MKLKVSAFKENREPIPGTVPQQPPSKRFVAQVEVDSPRGSGMKEVTAPTMEGVASGIDGFLDAKKFGDAKDFGCTYRFSVGKSEKKMMFKEDGVMVERSMLGPEEIALVVQTVDSAITRCLTKPKEPEK